VIAGSAMNRTIRFPEKNPPRVGSTCSVQNQRDLPLLRKESLVISTSASERKISLRVWEWYQPTARSPSDALRLRQQGGELRQVILRQRERCPVACSQSSAR